MLAKTVTDAEETNSQKKEVPEHTEIGLKVAATEDIPGDTGLEQTTEMKVGIQDEKQNSPTLVLNEKQEKINETADITLSETNETNEMGNHPKAVKQKGEIFKNDETLNTADKKHHEVPNQQMKSSQKNEEQEKINETADTALDETNETNEMENHPTTVKQESEILKNDEALNATEKKHYEVPNQEMEISQKNEDPITATTATSAAATAITTTTTTATTKSVKTEEKKIEIKKSKNQKNNDQKIDSLTSDTIHKEEIKDMEKEKLKKSEE